MPLLDLMKAIQASPIGTTIRESLWMFPVIECVHVLGLTFVFGTIALVDLRLLGVSARNHAVTTLSKELLPFTWAGFAVAVVSGGLLFISNAPTYFENTAFRIKVLLIIAAGVNMLIFEFLTIKSVKDWDLSHPAPTGARVAGALSLFFWFLVIVFGRRIGFTL